MNDFSDILVTQLCDLDAEQAIPIGAPPTASELLARVAMRRRRRQMVTSAGAVAAVALACFLILPKNLPWVVESDARVEFAARLDQIEQSVAALRHQQLASRPAEVDELSVLLKTLELERQQRHRAAVTAELAQREAQQPAPIHLAYNEALDRAENTALRLAIAENYEQHHELTLAAAGYERIVASEPETQWADRARERLAMLKL